MNAREQAIAEASLYCMRNWNIQPGEKLEYPDMDFSRFPYRMERLTLPKGASIRHKNVLMPSASMFKLRLEEDALITFEKADLRQADMRFVSVAETASITFSNADLSGSRWNNLCDYADLENHRYADTSRMRFIDGTNLKGSDLGLQHFVLALELSEDCILPDHLSWDLVRQERAQHLEVRSRMGKPSMLAKPAP